MKIINILRVSRSTVFSNRDKVVVEILIVINQELNVINSESAVVDTGDKNFLYFYTEHKFLRAANGTSRCKGHGGRNGAPGIVVIVDLSQSSVR